jgi:hypothetical protein
MARLPGEQDLGQLPGATVVGTDTSAIARGGADIAQGAQNLGRGVQQFGEGVASYGIDQLRYDYAKAHSYLLTGIIDQNNQTQADTNYQPDDTGQPLTVRHGNAVAGLQTQAAAMVPDGPMRERFMSETAPLIAKSNAEAANHARNLDNSANVAWVEQSGTTAINQGIATPDDDTRRALIDNHNQLVDGLVAKGAVSAVQAVQMKQTWATQFATADLLHRADTDPQGVIDTLQAAPGSGDDITNRIIKIEGTSKNPNSSANGVGQFVDSTWLDTIKKNRPDLAQGRSDQDLLALRADPALARQMTDALRQQNVAALDKAGAPTTPGAQYLAHFLGAGGAAAVLKADPNMPVADALTKAVGAKQAQAMIAANPSVLAGKLAGSVTQWADAKMGGVTPGGGSMYDILRPDVREQIISHAQTQIDRQAVEGRADFAQREANALQEAYDTGAPSKPLALTDYIAQYGAKDGPARYQQYDLQVQTGRAVNAMSTMGPQDRASVVESLAPKVGDPNYALKTQAYQVAQKANAKIEDALKTDPAGYAATKLPASRDAFAAYRAAAGNPAISASDRQAAAQHYAAVTLQDQANVNPNGNPAILAAGDVEAINKTFSNAANSDDPKARVGLIARVQDEAQTWGQYWPQVMRQMAPGLQPTVRAIAAGADPNAMTRLLSLDPKETVKTIVGEQNETKISDLTKDVNSAMVPLQRTLVGRQLDRDLPGYSGLVAKLGALYVRDGLSSSEAAQKAFGDVIGNRYDFRDTYRIPKSAGISPDDVQAGALGAREQLDKLGAVPPVDDIPGRSAPAAVDLSLLGRDGKWVTSPDNAGLNMIYGDKFVRTHDG